MVNRDSIFLVLGRNLRRIRKEKGLTQMQLSVDSGVAESQIAGIEQGKRNPTLDTLSRISKALGIKPKDLLI